MRSSIQLTIVIMMVCAVFFVCGCTTTEPAQSGTETPVPTAAPEEFALTVFHAGSLTAPFEEMKAAFEAEYPNVEVQLVPGGSTKVVKDITELDKSADVLASADYSLIPNLMVPDDADWYVTFAKNQMVLTYTDASNYADEITADNWYDILAREDVKWAFSDPNLDPCGYRTPMVIQLAELHYGDDQIFDRTVGANSALTVTEADGIYTIHATEPEPSGSLSIRPKSVELVQMVESGGLDYAWEYRSVAVQNNLKFIELPEAIDLSSVDYESTYALVQIECVGSEAGSTIMNKGSPIVYGVTVPKNADHPEAGLAFVKMLIEAPGQEIMNGQGQPPIVPAGGYGSVPSMLTSLVTLHS
ncbi:MAG: tungstate ABC transporter substrate-binding protein WtpA [Methanomicrobiaceae archaeon]|nr:tungstate ABC transporter substrate-binding protein WtpA [Methanomicrobiaceae archaeon]